MCSEPLQERESRFDKLSAQTALTGDVGDLCVVRAYKIIDIDECAVTMTAGTKGCPATGQPPINNHRPAPLAADRGNRAALVASRPESLSRIGEFHLAHAEQ